LQQAEEGRAEGLEGEGRGGREISDECVHLRALREEETGGGRALAPRSGGEEVGIRRVWITGDAKARSLLYVPNSLRIKFLQANYGLLTYTMRVKSSLGGK
jgi:hypothetical protein